MNKRSVIALNIPVTYVNSSTVEKFRVALSKTKYFLGKEISIKETMNLQIFFLRYFYNKLFTRFYHLGWKVVFGANVSIRRAQYISIGNKVYLDNNVVLQLTGKHVNYGFNRPKLKIDDGVTIGLGTMISAAKKINIEKNVLIGQHCFIGDHDHKYENVNVPIKDQGLKNVKPVIIKEGSWIGANVTIVSGVTVGKNSVIGANSVVTKDIPDYSVAVGVPARVIKQYNPMTKTWKKVRG